MCPNQVFVIESMYKKLKEKLKENLKENLEGSFANTLIRNFK